MGNLSKTGISSGTTINSTYITNLYDFFTGTTAYDNINIADWDYINAGGNKGESGFGFKNNSGTIQIKPNPDGTWGDLAAGEIKPSGSAGSIVFNDSTSFGGDDKFYFSTLLTSAVFQVGDTNHTDNKTNPNLFFFSSSS